MGWSISLLADLPSSEWTLGHVALFIFRWRMFSAPSPLHPPPQVREDALHLLHVLCSRHWGVDGPTPLPGTPPGLGHTTTATAAAATIGPSRNNGGSGFPGPSPLRSASAGRLSEEYVGAAATVTAVGGGGTAGVLPAPLVLVGNLQDQYQNFQLVVSSKFARYELVCGCDMCDHVWSQRM